MGDPNHKVHPCLGPIDEPPYYAVEVVPGDIGTCGGLVTNEHAQVIDQQDTPIEGLYATGNITATVMGRHYLGPGASIANSMVFGYLAARHATRASSVVTDGDGVSRALPRRRHDLFLGCASCIDDESDAVVVEIERARRLIDAVPRAHAHVAIDLDFEAHGPIVRRT